MQKNEGSMIVCYGDSNTYGYDPCVPGGGRYAEKEQWTALVEAKTGIPVKNYGLCGRKIPRIYEAQFQCVRRADGSLDLRSRRGFLSGLC